jgi:mRNA deadenylase 3'-5' endonuclease subunit Ccr4
MDQAPELEVVELGEAKEQTKGLLNQPAPEDHPTRPTRQPL